MKGDLLYTSFTYCSISLLSFELTIKTHRVVLYRDRLGLFREIRIRDILGLCMEGSFTRVVNNNNQGWPANNLIIKDTDGVICFAYGFNSSMILHL